MWDDVRYLFDLVVRQLHGDALVHLASAIGVGVLTAIVLQIAHVPRRSATLPGSRKALRFGVAEAVIYGACAIWLLAVSAAFFWGTPPEIQARDIGIVRWLLAAPLVLAAFAFVFLTLPAVRWDRYGVEQVGPLGRHRKIRWSDLVEVTQSSSKDSTTLRARDGSKLRFVARRGGGHELTEEAYAALARNRLKSGTR